MVNCLKSKILPNAPAFLIPSALFLAFSISRIETLMGQDEISHYFKIGFMLFNRGYASPEELITFSPHGYPLLLAAACRIAGEAAADAMRWIGILSWLASIFFVVRYTGRMWGGMILCCMPAVCQAAVLIDIDETVLVPACLFLWYSSICLVRKDDWQRTCLAAFAMCMALWCRLTTPFIICFVMLALYRRWRMAVAYAAGVVLFIASWKVYCMATGVNFAGPFQYLASSFFDTTAGSRGASLSRIVQSSVYVCLWGVNPMLCLLFLQDGRRRLRRWLKTRKVDELDSAWLCGAAILCGYMVIGGSLFGFPKYQCPAFPFMAISIASLMGSGVDARSRAASLAWCVVCSLFAAAFMFGDPLLMVRDAMRSPEAASFGPRWIFGAVSAVIAYLFAAVAAALPVCRRIGWRMAFLVSAIVFNMAFAYRQTAGRYSTGYIYGERGECARMAQRIRTRGLENKKMFIPAEVSHLLGGTDERAISPGAWNDVENMAAAIREEKPELIAVSHLIYNSEVMKKVLDSDGSVQKVLSEMYEGHRDCSLRYWYLKKSSGDDALK